MKIKLNLIRFILLIVSALIYGCDLIDCNYEKLSDKEYTFITELNYKYNEVVDTLYNDECLEGIFHIYLNPDSSNIELENILKNIVMDLRNENMKRRVWIFDNQKKFKYSLIYIEEISNGKIIKSDLMYPNE